MKNATIGVLIGLIVSNMSVWRYADKADLSLIVMTVAFIVTILMFQIDDFVEKHKKTKEIHDKLEKLRKVKRQNDTN